MIAVALTLALFLCWIVVGLAVVRVLDTGRSALQRLLLAPSVGIACIIAVSFSLNRLGLPIAWFSLPVTVCLVLLSFALLWWRRPDDWRSSWWPVAVSYLPFVAIFLLALVLTGRPMFEYGLGWVGYANEDMANYVLAAQRLVDGGFFDVPQLEDISSGRDYVQYYWSFIIVGERQGAELLLAWATGLTGLTGHEIFMPVIVALHLTLISAVGALIGQSGQRHLAGVLTCLLVALSALNGLGTLQQLIAQVGGVGLLASGAALLLTPVWALERSVAIRHGLLTGILCAGLFVFYTEILPFLMLAFGLYVAIALLRRELSLTKRPSLVSLGVAAGTGLVIVNTQLIVGTFFVIRQAGVASGGGLAPDIDRALFPYFLVPSGLATFWGLQSIGSASGEPWLSASIAVGLVLLAALIVSTVVLAWRGHATAVVTLAMLLFAAQLVRQGSGFGLFKLAMFIQPFMLGAMVLGCLSLFRRPVLGLVPLLALGAMSLPAHLFYVETSRGVNQGLVPNASASRMYDEMKTMARPLESQPSAAGLVLDTTNRTVAKFQVLYLRGIRSNFPSQYFFFSFRGLPTSPLIQDAELREIDRVAAAIEDARIEILFPWFPQGGVPPEVASRVKGDARAVTLNTIGLESSDHLSCDYMLGSMPNQTPLNRFNHRDVRDQSFALRDCASVQDHLIFTDSALGHDFYTYTATSDLISLNQLEPDVTFPGSTFAGIGRRLLFQVLNPSERPRLVLEMTSTFASDGDNSLPPATVIDAQRRPLGLLGRGSARVFSPPVTPIVLAGRPFVALDMGREGRQFSLHRTGLMRLFGANIPLDRRFLTGFARDISLISQAELDRLAPPTLLEQFPVDLTNRALEYSGIYEDGWISEASYFGLAQPDAASTVVVRGAVPEIGDPAFSTELQILVDGQEVARRLLRPGRFDVRAVPPPGAGRRRVELHFSNLQHLGGDDGRPVAAQLDAVGFQAGAATTPVDAITQFPQDVQQAGPAISGLDQDGWIAGMSFFWLRQEGAPADVVIRGMVPQINDPAFTTLLRVLVDGQEVTSKTLGLGDFEVRAPAPAGPGARRVELQFSATQALPAPDGRAVGAQLRSIEFKAGPSARP